MPGVKRGSSEHKKQYRLDQVKERYGSATDYDKEHADKMFSVQPQDVPLGAGAQIQKSIQGLKKVFRPYDK